MTAGAEFDFVFRFGAPSGYKGRACRVVHRPACGRDRAGRPIPNTGTETVTVEFEDGEQLRCIRSAIVRRRAPAALAAIEMRANGGLNRKERRLRDARQADAR